MSTTSNDHNVALSHYNSAYDPLLAKHRYDTFIDYKDLMLTTSLQLSTIRQVNQTDIDNLVIQNRTV